MPDAIATSWRTSLARAFRTFDDLVHALDLPLSVLAAAVERDLAIKSFPLLVPRSYVARMRRGDPLDPLLLQVLPSAAETIDQPGFVVDAVGDIAATREPGLIQKYQSRVLSIASPHCAVHCRYCFRRHFPYLDVPNKLQDLNLALESLRSDKSVTEVILSGGDPLLMNDDKLASLVAMISSLDHVRRLRIHTRLPIVLPDRITPDLLRLLRSTRLQPVMVVHANHPNEIVDDCATALQQVVQSGIPLLNQSVLLRRINDNVEALTLLSERLIDLGAMPYYLHQLDRVKGTSHFAVSDSDAIELVRAMRKKLPGYGVPRLVREIAGEPAKTLIY